MRINDSGITTQLKQIRERHGLGVGQFVPRFSDVEIGEDLNSKGQVEALFHPSGLLVRDGQPVLAYIRDHTSFGPYLDPQQGRKVHFTVCAALKSMKTLGRFERYRVTNKETNRYLVDVSNAWGRTEEREMRLYPCQYCLGNVTYRNFRYNLPDREKRAIVENYDAKDFFTLARTTLATYWEHTMSLTQATKDAKPATVRSGYPEDWAEISKRIRNRDRYTCGECRVRLDGRHDLLHVHHKNGDKSNVQETNLVSRCILCHRDEHPHLRITTADRLYVEGQRVGQGLSRL